ncbi:hypothetical protein, partial [Salipiger mucosus]|uniref:hypothetical protein n=1 Tax=Salipiger mucosus TaxID=263378 RepID=UPI00055A4077
MARTGSAHGGRGLAGGGDEAGAARVPITAMGHGEPLFAAVDRAGQATALPTLARLLEEIFRRHPKDAGVRASDGQPWHPIALEWECALNPMTRDGPAQVSGGYAPADIYLPPLDGTPPALSLLLGRPLAVVRARLRLELHGPPAIDRCWPVFARDLRRRT